MPSREQTLCKDPPAGARCGAFRPGEKTRIHDFYKTNSCIFREQDQCAAVGPDAWRNKPNMACRRRYVDRRSLVILAKRRNELRRFSRAKSARCDSNRSWLRLSPPDLIRGRPQNRSAGSSRMGSSPDQVRGRQAQRRRMRCCEFCSSYGLSFGKTKHPIFRKRNQCLAEGRRRSLGISPSTREGRAGRPRSQPPRALLRRGLGGRRRIVVEHRSEPALGLLRGPALAPRVILDLIALDLADARNNGSAGG
jgi:hypothetical protein